jgi:hypothetical protein
MSKDYIPDPDGDFFAWEQNFLAYVNANLAALGLVGADVAPLIAAQGNWTPAYADNAARQNAARAATDLKCQTRAAYETLIRSLVRRLQASLIVTDQQRRDMGITVRNGEPTPVGPVATQPVAIISIAGTLRHEIRFMDAATPTRRARPHGVIGCEIWVKVGDPAPVAETELTFLGLDTHSPYTAEHAMADAGKTAHYRLRWVLNNGGKSPWSEIESATITG